MRNMANLSVRLLVIALVAALALAGTNMITKDPIKQQQIDAADAARWEVIQADSFEMVTEPEKLPGWDDSLDSVNTEGVYRAISGGETMGISVELVAKGYGGDIIMTVGVYEDGSVSGLVINSHNETASLGSRITEAGFRGQFLDKDSAQAISIGDGDNDVAAISGATISSTAVVNGVNTACKAAGIVLGGAQ